MKHLIILGDGMADHAIDRLNGLTPLQAAHKPNIDLLAREGRTGRLITIPDGFSPGSEVANTAILGYDLNEVYEGRGPLEAASIGYEMRPDEEGQLSAQETADLINRLILRSQQLLSQHPFNLQRKTEGRVPANSIWPWSPGYRPHMEPLSTTYPQLRRGAVISAVDLIKGIGHYAGLRIIEVPGATGLADTNYEGKAAAALEALRIDDFVFLHVEASDEAGHDGDLALKLRTIENLDSRVVGPIYREVSQWQEPVSIAVLPDHPTPVEIRTHVSEPVPLAIWHRGIEPDGVQTFDEVSCVSGSYGMLRLQEFMQTFMNDE